MTQNALESSPATPGPLGADHPAVQTFAAAVSGLLHAYMELQHATAQSVARDDTPPPACDSVLPPDTPLLLTVQQAAQLLRISRPTAYAGVRTGSIPSVRLSAHGTRIPRHVIEDWLRRPPK